MQKILLNAKTKLLSALSVSLARKRLFKKQYVLPSNAKIAAEKQMLVDVSVIQRHDARSGIQRVVRALLHQLTRNPPLGYRVRPVFATRQHGYRYSNGFPAISSDSTLKKDGKSAVTVAPGDIFLGLDLAAHLLPRRQADLIQWKRRGVKLHIVVYDLLPVLHPKWFYPKTTRNFHRWLKTLALLADGLICISESVKAELSNWLVSRYALASDTIPIHTISLGADIESSLPSRGLPTDIEPLEEALGRRPTALMVGTLEPRKSYEQVLEAFEILWGRGYDINLAIVGKPGWKTEALQSRLRAKLQTEERLLWLDNASDEFLEFLYDKASGVILASKAEGFGLPLIEAEHHNKPVLARDIAVFREIAGNGVTFFSGDSPECLAESLQSWAALLENTSIPSEGKSRKTWQESAQELIDRLGLVSGCNITEMQTDMVIPEFTKEFPL